MKIKIIMISLLFYGMAYGVSAQDYSELDKILLKDKADCSSNEGLVLECSNYLLDSPIDAIDEDPNHMKALQFVMRWMEATPDYSFVLDESMELASGPNPSLLGVLLASMAKYALENKTDDEEDVKYNAFITFINYCEEPKHNVTLTREIKDLIKAKNENSLKEYLKINRNVIITRI